MKKTTDQKADALLLTKINVAVKAANEAETSVTTAQAELVSRSKAVGLLLLEAKKLHPKVNDFEAYLKRVDGLKLSRAYDLLKLAGGRTTDAELREEARNRKRKSRAKPKTKPEPKSKDSVTVTESAEEDSAEVIVDFSTTRPSSGDAKSDRNAAELDAPFKTHWPHMNAKARTDFAAMVLGKTGAKAAA
jgi:hypothetical protein